MKNEMMIVKQKVEKLKNALALPSVQNQIDNSLKENSGNFVASVIELYSGDAYLQKCDPVAVMSEALKAASLKLPINKNLGFCWVIPFKNKGALVPNFQMGYKGYIQLAMRTGQYSIINAGGVPDNYDVTEDLLSGRITLDKTDRIPTGKVKGYFAHIELVNGFSKTLYWTKEDVMAHAERYSQSYKSKYSPWANQFDEMATKTVLSKLLRTFGILSTEMQTAIINDSKDSVLSVGAEIEENANSEDFPEEKEVKAEVEVEETEDPTEETPEY